jgi:hypothetical protein
MIPQINSVCKGAFYHLRNIARIRKFLTPKFTEILVHAFISSKLDYYNSLLYGVPKFQLQKLQHVQNPYNPVLQIRPHHAGVKLTGIGYLVNIELNLIKLLLLTFKALNELAPKY